MGSGHTYFVLKDAGSQIHSVLFRSAQLRQRRSAEYLAQGSQVIVHGRLTVYEARGELQVVVDFVQPEGVGLRHAQFERLRLQLEEEGLFDPARKRPLPRFPRRVGVVTSPVGAVFHDICNVLRRRWPLAEVVLAPTPVQGPEAHIGIVMAIDSLNRLGDIEVIIVARGGGSIEELWPFNEETVARTVFGSAAPVISAVGHETDFTICDYVADLRVPTPSAAAEIVAPDGRQVRLALNSSILSGAAILQRALERGRAGAAGLVVRAESAGVDLKGRRNRLEGLGLRGLAATQSLTRVHRTSVQRCEVQLAALDPTATLRRGYAVVHKSGRVVGSIGEIATGDNLVVKVADGGFPARVQGAGQRRKASTPRPGRTASASDGSLQPVLFP
jgi:exodeoxyribonuclease VII large subunit